MTGVLSAAIEAAAEKVFRLLKAKARICRPTSEEDEGRGRRGKRKKRKRRIREEDKGRGKGKRMREEDKGRGKRMRAPSKPEKKQVTDQLTDGRTDPHIEMRGRI